MTTTIHLEPGKYYHVYNRGNNRENLFREERNYRYFLELYAYYVFPVAFTFAYCLMRNHFHFLIRLKEPAADAPSLKPSHCLGSFFNAYTKAFNATYQRTGALFERPFKRIEVTSDAYLYRLVTYIHQNPQRHGFVRDFRDWPYSSFHTLLSDASTRLCRDDVLDWFGGRQNIAALHLETLPPALVTTLAPGDQAWGME